MISLLDVNWSNFLQYSTKLGEIFKAVQILLKKSVCKNSSNIMSYR